LLFWFDAQKGDFAKGGHSNPPEVVMKVYKPALKTFLSAD
jgi:hypothetical protein